MNFNTKVKVTNIYRKSPESPIDFAPHGTVSESIKVNFGLGVISQMERDIGVEFDAEQGTNPRIKDIIWITKDGVESPLSHQTVEDTNRIYLEI